MVLNADFRPLSYYPLSLWSWQDAIKAVFLDRVNIVEHYDRAVRSPSFEIQLPSVVSLKSFVKPTTHPAFTASCHDQSDSGKYDSGRKSAFSTSAG